VGFLGFLERVPSLCGWHCWRTWEVTSLAKIKEFIQRNIERIGNYLKLLRFGKRVSSFDLSGLFERQPDGFGKGRLLQLRHPIRCRIVTLDI